MELNFKLEVFEGPLDLLLSLIEKNKIDIYDIEIHILTDQYLAYIEEANRQGILELTASFIEMASRLNVYKNLAHYYPKEEDEEDPKATLEEMLQQYAKYKQVSEFLKTKYIGNRIFFREVTPLFLPKPFDKDNLPAIEDLQNAYISAIESERKKTTDSSIGFQKTCRFKIYKRAEQNYLHT